MFDLQYNLGSTKFNPIKWSTLHDALKAKDWAAVAREMHRKDVQMDRNDATQNRVLRLLAER